MATVGEVILVWDRHTRPPKDKRHICICPIKQQFLRINSNPYFPPHHLLLYANNTNILDHDSYVELNRILRHYASDINQARSIGIMHQTERHALIAAAYNVTTLTDEQKDFIAAQLQ